MFFHLSSDQNIILRHHSNQLFHAVCTQISIHLQRWKREQTHLPTPAPPPMPPHNLSIPINATSPASALPISYIPIPAIDSPQPRVLLPHPDQHTSGQPDPQPAAVHYTPPMLTTSHTQLATDLPTYTPLVLAAYPTQPATTDPPICSPLTPANPTIQPATTLSTYSPLVHANSHIQPATDPPTYSPLVHASSPTPGHPLCCNKACTIPAPPTMVDGWICAAYAWDPQHQC